MSLGLQIFTDPSGALFFDALGLTASLTFTTNEHGFAALDAFVPLTLAEQFRLYDRPGLPHVVVSDNGGVVWEGRMEDAEITGDGIRLGAFGYQRAMSDVPYSGIWSTADYKLWREIQGNEASGVSNVLPKMYVQNNDARIFIGLTKNSTYTTSADLGMYAIDVPHNGNLLFKHISFNYEVLLPNNWAVRCSRWNADYSTQTTLWTHAANGSSQTGSQSYDFTSGDYHLTFHVFNNTGADSTYTGESGDNFIKITGLRVYGTDAVGSCYADEIARGLVAHISGINSTQLSSSTALISSPAVDLTDEIYEDLWPSTILDRLALYGDNSSPSQLYEWGVWENQMLHFRRRGSRARTWYVDISNLQLQRTINALGNSVYGVYRDGSGRTQRTSISSDSSSIARYGVTRRSAQPVETTSSTQAGVYRDVSLNDRKDPIPRIKILFTELYDASGARWPLYSCRAMDTIVIRNLPPTLSASIDRIRSFRTIETSYDAIADVLTVTPESPLPMLDWMIARHAIGTEIE